MYRIKSLISLFCAVLFTATTFAGGYQVRLQGNKNNGIGLIGSPFSWGASSIFYNPGALSFSPEKYNFSIGGSFVNSNATFQSAGSLYTAETNNPVGTPAYLYMSAHVSPRWTVGMGVYTPYGSSIQWDTDWAGRNLVQSISMKSYFFQPTVAYKISDQLSVGAGFVYAVGAVKFEKGLNYSPNAYAELDGDTDNFGYNVGIMYKPSKSVSIGLDYRSRIDMEIDNGNATFFAPPAIYDQIPMHNKFSATLPLPANLDLGVAWEINEKWLVAAELNYVQWSAYKELSFTFAEKGELLNNTSPRNYKDVVIARVGAQYKLNDMIVLRAGGYYDPSPADKEYFTPETVTLNTIGATLGASIYPVKGLSIDISYLQTFGLEAEKSFAPENFNGTYKTSGIIPGIGINYNF